MGLDVSVGTCNAAGRATNQLNTARRAWSHTKSNSFAGSRRLVGAADCFVDAAAGQPPGHVAWLVLVEVPAGCLLGAVMPSAGGCMRPFVA